MARSPRNHGLVHRHPDEHATAIAQVVDTAWNKSHHSGRRDVALSVVAALALVSQRDSDGPDLGRQLRNQTPENFVETIRGIYTALANSRPDLTHLVYPLMRWAFDEPEPALCRAAKQTADAALHAGQLALTGTDRRYDTDLLGVVLTLLKSHTAAGANAQIYTPSTIARVMARMNSPQEGEIVQDPAVGTGGLFRAVAEAMREQGRDPTSVTWVGADIDNLAIAACAVNSFLWGLGTRVPLAVANTLAEGDWETRAYAQRDEVLRWAESIRRDKLMLTAIRRACELADTVTDDTSERSDSTQE